MPILVDDDLRFEDGVTARPAVAVNQWLRELPVSGCPSPQSWWYYARTLRSWIVFLARHRIGLFAGRSELRAGLGMYAEFRSAGPAVLAATTWNQHMSILSSFYRWSIAEGYAVAEPFTYRAACAVFAGIPRRVMANQAMRRVPKPHVTVKYLEPEFAGLFVRGLRGLEGGDASGYRGRENARNGAVGGLALATGLRLQEFTYLLVFEVPGLPRQRSAVPVPFPVAEGLTKGRKFRTTWVSYDALAAAHDYIGVDRAAAVDGSRWLPPAAWGEPLFVTEADARGGRVNGVRRRWASMGPGERRRLVAADGGSCLLAVRSAGGPFTAWPTVFARTAQRLRAGPEPRFPHVHPHRLRHSFAMMTLMLLVGGYYRQAAQLVAGTDADAALVLYLSKADPLMVLRDLLGHSSVLTTEMYLRRLDTTRIYRDAYERAGAEAGLLDRDAAEREADGEFAWERD